MDYSTKSTNQTKLDKLKFDNKALRSLPVDCEQENYIRTVHNAVIIKEIKLIKSNLMINKIKLSFFVLDLFNSQTNSIKKS